MAERPCTSIPLISVCIPVRNRKEMLRSCLRSVVRQTFADIEIIVSDNCSEDNLREVIDEFDDPRIVYCRNQTNIGAVRNHIKAASLARGKYIKFLCSDDLLLPNCLEESLRELQRHPGVDAIISRVVIVSEHAPLNPRVYSLPFAGVVKNMEYQEGSEIFAFANVGPTAWLMKRDAFWELGGFDRSLGAMIDWELYYQLLRNSGGVAFFDRVLAVSVAHQSNDALVCCANLTFFRDVLQLRRRGVVQNSAKYADLIWRQLSQAIRCGHGVLPVLKLAYAYGYLGHFVLSLPALVAKHAWARLKVLRQTPDDAPVPEEVCRALHDTWSACKVSKSTKAA
ncbi:MAG: glycosyltransferase [Pirellulaceae bacterium]|nr:glycosyltransferase [Pirellulaceae bacterium]